MKKILFTSLIFVLTPLTSLAATLYVGAPPSAHVGDTFTAEIFLDTDNQNLNAFEGSITIPRELELTDIRYSGSVVSLWLTEPKERTPGVVDFAGIIPGGYQASPERVGRGTAFTLVVRAKEAGTASLGLSGGKAYINDGVGTAQPLTLNPASISISQSTGVPVGVSIDSDTVPPQPFIPEIVSGESFGLEGNVLVFSTTDKDSGVAKYQLARSLSGFMVRPLLRFSDVTSPYTLQAGDAEEYLFVRALDQSGNERIAIVGPEKFSIATFLVTWIVPLLIILGIVFLARVLTRGTRRVF